MKGLYHLFLSLTLIAALLTVLTPAQFVAKAAPTELFFSEYIEGTSNNKALEIYNGTGATVNLAAGGYNVQMYFNGSASPGLTINLTGSVANGDVFVLAHSSASAAILAQADQTNGAGWFNGDDAVVLRKGTTIIDVIGQIGFDPGTEWGSGLTSTADNTLRRKSTVEAGDPNGSDAFDPSLEWEGFATDTFGGLGSHLLETAPTVVSTFPVDGATGVPVNTTLSVTFSEAVNVSGDWFTLVCTISGSHSATVSGGPTTFTLDPATDFVAGESCTLTILAANVSDQDANDPPDNMSFDFTIGFSTVNVCELPFTPIYSIQGSGATAAIVGTVTTQGVVVGDYEGPSPNLRGFYLQDLNGDGDAATSDGIFIFNGNNNNVVLGDVVRVTGSASEFQGQTQISASAITNCGTGTIAPVEVTLPFPTVDFPERYEGMLVRLPQTLYVTEHFQLGRFGQVVMSSGGRLQQPTNVYPAGPDAEALQAANNLNRIIVDDALNNQNPDPILFARGGNPLSASNTLRGGDTATGIVGIMTYTWSGNAASGNAYRVRPVNALGGGVPNFQPTNERPASAPPLSGRLRVSAMNLLNFFNTFDGLPDTVDNCTLGVGGGPTDCRGADTATEFARQWPKTVAAILKIDADVIGLIEIENDGYGAASAIQFLVDRLNAASAPGTYAFIDVDAATGQVNALGTDAIKVGLIYKPAKVTPIGQTAVLNNVEFVNGGDATARNRPALAQAFEENGTGARFVVSVNHLKSKGSPCDIPDQGDGQGNCNIVRLNAANLLTDWLASDPTGTNEPDVLILGDLNSYAKEDPILAIESDGYTNLIEDFVGASAYSYVFDGQWGYLDHALGNTSLAPQVTGVWEYHINSDEPSVLDYNTDFKTANLQNTLYAPDEFRVSDHDPVLVDLNLRNDPPIASAGGPYTANEGETVSLSASGYDPDGTAVSFAWDLDNDGSFETPGQTTSFSAIDGTYVYTVSVQVMDATGLASVASALVTVNNVAPTLGPISGPIGPMPVNTPLTFSASFSDPGVLDTHTALWNWGDGTTSVGAISEINGSGTASDTHSYLTAGIYTIRLTVTDKDSGISNEVSFMLVIYDPNGGFVTGGGWIDSPAGAYLPDPTLSGKATFGFVAKYKKGSSVPDGNTQFVFHAGKLNFHSQSYEWLVVNRGGNNAQFKGRGMINGEEGYLFMIWTGDGSPDTFRIKLWREDSSGEFVVYDNGADQALSGGSIIIHK